MNAIHIPLDVLRKFFASAYGLPEPKSSPTIETKLIAPLGVRADHERGSPEWRSKNAKAAADARHSKPGGAREKQANIRELWATGKYSNRDRCAEEEYLALGMSFSTARKALRGTPSPKR